MVASLSSSLITILSLAVCLAAATHIDNENGELSNLKFDQVIFRLKKDCSLDRQPEVTHFPRS